MADPTSASDQIYTIETINPASSYTPGIAASSDVVAILPLNGTTVTAWQVTGTTGLAVVDGTTLSFRQQGITLSNGVAISLGFYGLEDSTTTALYSTETSLLPSTAPTATATATATATSSQTATAGSIASFAGSSTAKGSQSATSASGSVSSTTSASGAQQLRMLCAGKTLFLLSAVLGFMFCVS
ncbi:hypothetical protein EJ03DRAFT_328234 [Teratosphaeria nubilosa]|uniref:Uncharacterized protein n=1 Tax=Teratosphaeria nubilosa TaxID=161662 RepID=A0A6G1L8L4_9PEZI|nr:hypothetical protein EJ03DRAFT_328234 [Teratosphaeria nubilosa]